MTDRIDTEGPLRVLAAYRAGDSPMCSMVWVPTLDEEDGKRVDREREYLVQDWTRIENGCWRFSRPEHSFTIVIAKLGARARGAQ